MQQQNAKENEQSLKVLTRMVNEAGQTYFLRIKCDNPGKLVRELWLSCRDGFTSAPKTDEDACSEWTDRMRCYRTKVDNDVAGVWTHWWDPSGDKNELHKDVLSFLRAKGLDV